MPSAPPVVLTIAGFDPGSGAGVTADIKTIAAHGCYGVACITALTVQSTRRVARVEAVSAEIIRETLDELAVDIEISSVHVGMLGNVLTVQEVGIFLRKHKLRHVVLDPIIRSSSGRALLDSSGVGKLKDELLPLASVITPNAAEAEELTGMAAKNADSMRQAAAKLHKMGARAVVITGGDLPQIVDLLSIASEDGVQQTELRSERVASNSTHGTGCAFSTAIACNLALGKDLRTSVTLAKSYVESAITAAYPIGKGKGPLHHLHRFDELRK